MSDLTKQFVKKYYPYAKMGAYKTGISPIFLLAQGALESGWGKHMPGNMIFGIKDTDGINGNEQLLTTTEYHKSEYVKYPVILSVIKQPSGLFKYTVRDYFRKYPTAADSFADHAEFFLKNKRYKTALMFKKQPVAFAKEVARAGYATDPLYFDKMFSIISTIKSHIEELDLA